MKASAAGQGKYMEHESILSPPARHLCAFTRSPFLSPSGYPGTLPPASDTHTQKTLYTRCKNNSFPYSRL